MVYIKIRQKTRVFCYTDVQEFHLSSISEPRLSTLYQCSAAKIKPKSFFRLTTEIQIELTVFFINLFIEITYVSVQST